MRYYHSYMDRQEISPSAHEKLLNLCAERKLPCRPWVRYAALAACAALILGVGVWGLNPGSTADQPGSPSPVDQVPAPTEAVNLPQLDDAQPVEPPEGFVVSGPAQGDKLAFPMIPYIHYQDVSAVPETAASRAFAPGSFTVDLTREDIQAIFWGAQGKPEAGHPKTKQGDLPWMLFWDGYTVHGYAWYDGQGQLTELTIRGDKGRASFTLELRLGALPFTCCVDMSRGDQISQFNGVDIAAWSRVYDRDGDGLADYICGSEFMTPDDIGVRFENHNSAMEAEYDGGTGGVDPALDGACTFNALFVRQALTADGGLHLDHLMAADYIPSWREESFDTLDQARQEADFAPYLPQSAPISDYTDISAIRRDGGICCSSAGAGAMTMWRWRSIPPRGTARPTMNRWISMCRRAMTPACMTFPGATACRRNTGWIFTASPSGRRTCPWRR